MRLALAALVLTTFLACNSSQGAGPTLTATPIVRTSVTPHVTATAVATRAPTATPTPTPSASLTPTPSPKPTPTPVPTVSPTPIAIHHAPPYIIAIDAGHGGAYYWGGSAYDNEGRRYIEKDVALEVALKVRDWLLTDEQRRYIPVLIRDGDYTLTDFDANDYRGSQRTELQARVDVANAVNADVLLSVHFNGWPDAGQQGTETYCNPDRSFGPESCQLAWIVQNHLVGAIREYGYDIVDRGSKNDAEVGGDPSNPHSYLLGTNYAFNPSLMPGIISEILFLSSPVDLEFLKKPEAADIFALTYKKALDEYFGWLVGSP